MSSMKLNILCLGAFNKLQQNTGNLMITSVTKCSLNNLSFVM